MPACLVNRSKVHQSANPISMVGRQLYKIIPINFTAAFAAPPTTCLFRTIIDFKEAVPIQTDMLLVSTNPLATTA
jgi:hypothetical protein